MPFLVAALGRVLLWALGTFLGKIIIGLGIGFVAFQGVDVAVSALQTKMAAQASVSGIFAQAADVLGFWDALNIIISAYTARFATGTAYKLALRKAT